MTEVLNTHPLTPDTVKVGDGVTERVGSDRYGSTVTYVSPTGKTLRYTHDKATAAEGHEYYGLQKYDHTSVEERSYCQMHGEDCDQKQDDCWVRTNAHTAKWSPKRGVFVPVGAKSALTPGRRTYSDPSF